MIRETAPASAITSIDVENYSRDGYLILRRVFNDADIAAMASEAKTLFERRELIDTNNIRCRWQDHCESGECLFDCFDPVIDIGPVARAIACDERILAPLRALYDDDAHLFKDKLIFKPPGAKGYALHQDYIAWKEFPESFTTVIVAIDPADASNGATELYSGYHPGGYMSPRDGMYHELSADAVDPSRRVSLELDPGDIAIFSGFTPHCSEPNRSNRWRRQLYLSYNANQDGGDQREAHYGQFHAWLKDRYAEYGRTNVYFH
ncbi:MAG TPA: phytanoyl-CoA dioxygenase family protein [Pirellulales bacterium]|nr:phytanoyl-CoA dioxygenase family protein [Pirellulales bacterium]